MVIEVWKDIERYEGIYQVSNMARIKSLDRIDCRGQHRKERVLKQAFDSDGYCIVTLSKERIGITKKVHRLVAQAFIPNPEDKPEVNHIDGVKSNNQISNLEWATSCENQKHSRRIGLHPEIAETHKSAKLTNSQVLEIFNSSLRPRELSKLYNIGTLTIFRIKSGYNWSSVTGKEYKRKKAS